jgi:CheY-like chemotaxis protein
MAPAVLQASGQMNRETRSSSRSQQNSILCVDDDVLGSRIRTEILESEGYSVVLHHCPLEVLQSDISEFSLAIVDFTMPKMNGRELLIRMRALGATFPIVLLSGHTLFLSHEDRVLFFRYLCAN